MPKFLHQDNPDLSDLNRAKKSVNSDYAKQYQSQDGNHDNLGQTQDVDSIYNTLSTRLLALQTALQDVFNILEVGGNSDNFFSAQQRATFQQFASRVLTEINAVQLIMSRIQGFNAFTPPQSQGLQGLVAEISALNDFINGVISTLGGVAGQQLADVINTYQPQIKLLLQFLVGASSNYKAIEANPKSVEAMYGGYSFKDAFQSLGDFGRSQKDHVYAFKLADDLRQARTGGAIVPAYNGEGRFGSDGYRIGDYYTYNDPRRFY